MCAEKILDSFTRFIRISISLCARGRVNTRIRELKDGIKSWVGGIYKRIIELSERGDLRVIFLQYEITCRSPCKVM